VNYKHNARNIEGIHNYCDRWCERCYFTSRCAVYENTGNLPPEEKDISNKAFWERIGRNFSDAITILQAAAKKHNVDLDAVSEEENLAFKQRKHLLNLQIKKHPLSELSLKYIKEGKKLFDNDELLNDKRKELIYAVETGIHSEEQTIEEAATIKDCAEVVQWYLHFIYVKLQRAMHGKMDGEKTAGEDRFPKDSDGSAKIALISVDRSIEAWVNLLHLIPQQEDAIISLLSLLQKIKAIGEAEFPDARKFIRPGFDEQ
jgi:hypothetical protein